MYNFTLTHPRYVEDLAATEVREHGGQDVVRGGRGISFKGDLGCAYRLCLHSRIANRILLDISEIDELPDASALYAWLYDIPFENYLTLGQSFAFDANAYGTSWLRDHRFAAQKAKDALVDRWREKSGERPNVDPKNADLRFRLDISKGRGILSLDFGGGSLHARSLGERSHQAPLKENVAAALLMRAGFSSETPSLLDPMCGTGTLVIEAALMARGRAPRLQRQHYAFFNLPSYDEDLWKKIKWEAQAQDLNCSVELLGADNDLRAIENARSRAKAAGVEDLVEFHHRPLSQTPKSPHPSGLVVSNPPYGERLGDEARLCAVYRAIGRTLKETHPGHQLSLLSSNEHLMSFLGLGAKQKHTLKNGPLDCELLHFTLQSELKEEATDLRARLKKNKKKRDKEAKREKTEAYRIYDADLPDYAVAIDRYGDKIQIAEYQAPKTIDPKKARRRLRHCIDAVADELCIPYEKICIKVRKKQRGTDQYERGGKSNSYFLIQEGDYRFQVNLVDYLDTGIFLDHRNVRRMLPELVKGKSFLNLFCYTATASVYAAQSAQNSLSVDMSRTYLDWAEENYKINGVDRYKHRLLRADALKFLEEPESKFDVVLFDPPTFSNSKKMDQSFDVLRDHPEMLQKIALHLNPGGTIIFSNNAKRFKLDPELKTVFSIEEITEKTRGFDSTRAQPSHRCFMLQKLKH